MSRSLKSVTAGGNDKASRVAKEAFTTFAQNFPTKFYWFSSLKDPYAPHEWQAAFHAAEHRGKISRYRHLVAGRRGGKTLSAAWEVLFYCLFPAEFHMDVHGEQSDRPLHVWALAKDHEVGRPSRDTFQEVIDQAGLIKNKDYTWNKTEKFVTFTESGSRLQFRTAEDPQSLRGAGLDILWIDEAAMVPDAEAYNVARPALSDKLGIVITTTTPRGKNWLYEEFWGDVAQADPRQFRVEYTSIDNPYFPKEEWDEVRARYHPIMFKQEYMASFDAMSGVELHGDWLHYYVYGKPEPQSGDIGLPKDDDGRIRLRKYIGVDPAISQSDSADYFAMCLVGVSPDNTQAFILKTLKERLPFPDQIDKIKEWFHEHRPEFIGIESNAFQRSLEQQASRMEGLPPIVPIISKGKKAERILPMGPVFKVGKVRLHRSHKDFVDEWVSYDSTLRNPKDDLLDATEIALSAAGVLLPTLAFTPEREGPSTLEEEALAHLEASSRKRVAYDPELGQEA